MRDVKSKRSDNSANLLVCPLTSHDVLVAGSWNDDSFSKSTLLNLTPWPIRTIWVDQKPGLRATSIQWRDQWPNQDIVKACVFWLAILRFGLQFPMRNGTRLRIQFVQRRHLRNCWPRILTSPTDLGELARDMLRRFAHERRIMRNQKDMSVSQTFNNSTLICPTDWLRQLGR